MISQILQLFKAINSEDSPWQIAFAGALAMIIGFTPLWSLHNLIILFIAFIFRINLATFFVFWAVFSGIAFLLDPWFHSIGLYWLERDSLNPFWTQLYQNDFWLVTHFNHTVTLGSFLFALAAFIPAVLLFRLGVTQYRVKVMPWINKLKIVQILKGSRLYQLYARFEG